MENIEFKAFICINGNEVIMTNENLRKPTDEFDDSRDIAHAVDTLTDGTPIEFWLWGEGDFIFLDACVKKASVPQISDPADFEQYLCANGFEATLPEGWVQAGSAISNKDEYRLQFYHEQDF